MSQSDYNIANQSFPAARVDMNNTFVAGQELNSGATEPSTIFAYQIWVDTTENVIKQRNGANSAWVIRGTADDDRVISKATTYTVLLEDFSKTILSDSTGGAFDIDLPPAATAEDGFFLTIKKTDISANDVTVDPDLAETIDGDPNFILSKQNDFVTFVSDGSNWQITGASDPGDNSVTLAKLAPGTAGNLISFDPAGDPVAVATGTAAEVLTSNGVGLAPTFQAVAVQTVLQFAITESRTISSGAGTIPYDDTIPQISEGNEFIILVFTPVSATSTLVIEIQVNGSEVVNAVDTAVAALFVDATANALSAADIPMQFDAAGRRTTFIHTEVSGSTSPRTYRLRAGMATGGGSFAINASLTGSGGKFSTSRRPSYIKITEFA